MNFWKHYMKEDQNAHFHDSQRKYNSFIVNSKDYIKNVCDTNDWCPKKALDLKKSLKMRAQ